MLTDSDIHGVEAGDPQTLCRLDARGLLVGAGETAADFAERLRCLRRNTRKLEEDLARDGSAEIENVRLEADRRIPPGMFEEAEACTRSLYAFAIDWVPGFFINPSFSLLFGGCAFYFHPDFFALFIIRRSFETRHRWLIYDRTELLAHELCHVARIGLESESFEESVAYQTSHSALRRAAGGVFQRPADSFLLLGSTFLLLAVQMLRTLLLPGIPAAPFWALVVGVIAFFALRQRRLHRLFRQAERALATLCGDNARAALFRCTDEEIRALGAMREAEEVRHYAEKRAESELRWTVILRRFVAEQPAG